MTEVTTKRREVARIGIALELRRAFLPLEIYPISAGIKGGLAGSVAMALVAMLYGILSRTSIWYPINLLAAGFFPATANTALIAAFHLRALLIAIPIHLITSLLVGLLYGAMLPMLPRRPVLLGGSSLHSLVWTGSQHPRDRESGDEPAHRLGLVCGVAVRIWDCGGCRRFLAGTHTHTTATAARLPLGMEASGMKDEPR